MLTRPICSVQIYKGKFNYFSANAGLSTWKTTISATSRSAHPLTVESRKWSNPCNLIRLPTRLCCKPDGRVIAVLFCFCPPYVNKCHRNFYNSEVLKKCTIFCKTLAIRLYSINRANGWYKNVYVTRDIALQLFLRLQRYRVTRLGALLSWRVFYSVHIARRALGTREVPNKYIYIALIIRCVFIRSYPSTVSHHCRNSEICTFTLRLIFKPF